MLSIIIPTYNEMQHGYLTRIIPSLASISHKEIICADSGSTDGTLDYLATQCVKVYQVDSVTRAARLNQGVHLASGDMLLLYHPRILIDPTGITALMQFDDTQPVWGGFTHTFLPSEGLLKFISWYSNHVRVKKKNLVYLDHGIFLHKQLADSVFPLPDEPIFEDTVLSRRLARITKANMLDYRAEVSPVRFEHRGPLKQFLTNQCLKLGFACGISPTRLNRWYEKKLALNSKIQLS